MKHSNNMIFSLLIKKALLCILMCIPSHLVQANDNSYTTQEKEYLLNLARTTLCWYTYNQSIPYVDQSILPPKLIEQKGCFVTLTYRSSGLRGCIGSTIGYENLYKAVINKTIDAAIHDPRFNPVSYDEIKDIKISISILSVPHRIYFDTPEQLLSKLTQGKDGVIIRTPYGSSTFLPQVWKVLTDKQQFLSQLCIKHGAPALTWEKNKDIEIYIYHAIHFEENTYGRIIVGSMGAIVGKKGAQIIGKAQWNSPQIVPKFVKAGEILQPLFILTPNSDINQK